MTVKSIEVYYKTDSRSERKGRTIRTSNSYDDCYNDSLVEH